MTSAIDSGVTSSTLARLTQDADAGLSGWEVLSLFGLVPAALAGVIAAVSWRLSRNTNTDRFPLLRNSGVLDPDDSRLTTPSHGTLPTSAAEPPASSAPDAETSSSEIDPLS